MLGMATWLFRLWAGESLANWVASFALEDVGDVSSSIVGRENALCVRVCEEDMEPAPPCLMKKPDAVRPW